MNSFRYEWIHKMKELITWRQGDMRPGREVNV